MNPFERTAQLSRELVEINTETVRKITELSVDNFKKYVQLNQDYLQKLPEVREAGAFVELQRTYGESLWKGLQDDLKARSEIIREAVEETSGIFRNAFQTTVEETNKASKAATKPAAA